MAELPPSNSEHVEAAVAELIQKVSPGGFLQGYHVIVALIDETGEPQLYGWEMEGQQIWTTLGYLDCATTEIRARFVNGADDED